MRFQLRTPVARELRDNQARLQDLRSRAGLISGTLQKKPRSKCLHLYGELDAPETARAVLLQGFPILREKRRVVASPRSRVRQYRCIELRFSPLVRRLRQVLAAPSRKWPRFAPRCASKPRPNSYANTVSFESFGRLGDTYPLVQSGMESPGVCRNNSLQVPVGRRGRTGEPRQTARWRPGRMLPHGD